MSRERIFLWFDASATGLLYASDEGRSWPAGVVQPDDLPLSDDTVAALRAWVEWGESLVPTAVLSGGRTSNKAARKFLREQRRLWYVLRDELAHGYQVGYRGPDGVEWSEEDVEAAYAASVASLEQRR